MHPFVARLLVVSLGTFELAGCADTVRPPRAATGPKPFDALAETSPDIVAEAYAGTDLKSGPHKLSAKQCRAVCGPEADGCEAFVVVSGGEHRPTHMTGNVECSFHDRGGGGGFDPFGLSSCPFGCGRRPASVEVPRAHCADPLVSHVTEIAILESLSVDAFTQLARDLRQHAPRFLPRVRRARRDERRHARHARAVLRELGGSLTGVPRVALVTRGLVDAALDNAVEGCIHETFGAVAASVQARRAEHPSMRRFFEAIARDELEHAALSWDVHDELWPGLGPHARATITEAQVRALAQIEAMPALPESVRARVGAPTLDERRALVRVMQASLLSHLSPGVA